MAVKKIAVYIGRFQPFHVGHAHILETALRENDHTVVLVGSANQAPTIKNPFTFKVRSKMINSWAESKGEQVIVMPIEDDGVDTNWILSVQRQISAITTLVGLTGDDIEVTLYGADKDSSSWYVHSFPQWKKALLPVVPLDKELSATELRKQLFGLPSQAALKALEADLPKAVHDQVAEYVNTPEYQERREEYAFIEAYKQKWAAAPYAPTFLTVDGVIIQSGHVLVIRRANQPGRGLIALPGGFVKPSQTLVDALVAEIVEETGMRLAEGKRSEEITKDMLRQRIRATLYFDDPNRSLRGRTVTHAFLIRLDDMRPLPKVMGMDAPLEDTNGVAGIPETLEAFWMPLHKALASPAIWFEDHYIILKKMVSMIKE